MCFCALSEITRDQIQCVSSSVYRIEIETVTKVAAEDVFLSILGSRPVINSLIVSLLMEAVGMINTSVESAEGWQ